MNQEEKQLVMDMEAKYDSFKPKLDQFQESLMAFKEAYADYTALRSFYGSQEWFELREKPHDDLKAGVLSEDQLYNFIVDHGDILSQLLELSADMYKHI